MLDNQDPFGLIKNDETGEAVYSNDQDDGNIESNRNSAISNVMPRTMVDDEILERVSIL